MLRLSKEVKEFMIQTLGKKEGKKLIDAVHANFPIILNGPHYATGKTTIQVLLRSLGYDRVYVLGEGIKTIRAEIPVPEPYQPLNEVLESLGIGRKYLGAP